MTSRNLQEFLAAIMEVESSWERTGDETLPGHLTGRVERVQSLEDTGIHTGIDGLVIQMEDGAEFQITTVQSRHPTARGDKFMWGPGDIQILPPPP
jgi:hypothetical protein